MTVGFRIRPVTSRVDPLCARAALPAANIGDVVNRMQTMRGGFLRLWRPAPGGRPGLHRCGPAAATT